MLLGSMQLDSHSTCHMLCKVTSQTMCRCTAALSLRQRSVTEASMCCTQAWFLAEKCQLTARKPSCHCMGQISGHQRCTCMVFLRNMPLMPCLFSLACRSTVHHVCQASEGLLDESACCRGFCRGTRLPCRPTWMPYVAWQIACSLSLP